MSGMAAMQHLGPGRITHIASNRVDEEAVRLVEQWIREMPREGSPPK
jgi:hypothetical protein